MIRKSSPHRKVRLILSGLLLFIACLQAMTLSAITQSTIARKSSILADLASKRTANFKVSFMYGPGFPKQGQIVQFADTSSGNPTSWQWDFGDGSTSTAQNPSHMYSTAGFRKVTLIATCNVGSKKSVKTITIMPEGVASFVHSPTTPGPGQTVQFADTSSGNPTSWQWDFGDGAKSTTKNPSHVYQKAASYTVALISSDSSGSKQGSDTIIVASMSVLSSSFNYSPALPSAGQIVQFTDTSAGTPTSWQWNFGDGSTSTAQNPSHSYATAGSKTVTLAATNASGSNSSNRTVTVVVALAASFSYSPASPAAGQSVQFMDTSTGNASSWQWSFGDGGTSTSQNPSHTYATAGSKTVTLTVTNSSGSNTTTLAVTVAAVLAASFSYSPASPTIGQSVQFTDTSTGSASSWQWSFGDGGTSTSRNPSHTYATAGSKTVTLTVTNTSGSSSTTKTLTVTAALAASFTFSPASPTIGRSVQFMDTSTGSPTHWQWDFNDGATSTAQNPSHTFSSAGSYAVVLTVSNGTATSNVSQIINVLPSSVLAASFTYSPASPVEGHAVQFTDTSTGSPTSWQWDFGDGGTSTAQNPSHTFASVSSYTVTLAVSNSSGSDSLSKIVNVSLSSAIIVTNPTYANVSAAVAQAVDGGTIELQSTGTYTWSATLVIPNTKGISIKGPGTNTINTRYSNGSPNSVTSNFPLIISSSADPAIQVNCGNNNSLTRISGLKFTSPIDHTDGVIYIKGRGTGKTGIGAYRIDNNYFEGIQSNEDDLQGGITIDSTTGVKTGLVDSNIFHDFGYGNNTGYGISITELWQYGGSGYDYSGNNAWTRTFAFGSSDFVFIEDNVFESVTYYTRHLITGSTGAKYVARFNTFDVNKDYSGTYTQDIDAHGLCYNGTGMGARGGEIYGNTFKGTQNRHNKLFLRGGAWLAYDNSFLTASVSANGQMAIYEYRAFSNCSSCQTTHNGVTGYTQCLAQDGSGYPAPQQVTGSYFWNNLWGGANVMLGINSDGGTRNYIQEGRDVFTSDTKPAGMSGYNAYTYPHPLR